MNTSDFQVLARATSEVADSWAGPMQGFQALRRRLKGRIRASGLFGPDNIKPDYAFHWGGRGEFQLNMGLESGGELLRVGLAFSLEPSDKVRDVLETLGPKILHFNKLVSNDPSVLAEIEQAYWVRKGGTQHHAFAPGPIPDEAQQVNVFIFLGNTFPASTVTPEVVLQCWDRMLPLYESVEGAFSSGAGGIEGTSSRAWALYSSQDGERSFQGNGGYDDKLGRYLSYDNQVANSLQVKEGDRILIWDGERVYGTSVIERIASGATTKVMKVCPECETTTLYPRKRLAGLKCISCKKTWDQPKIVNKLVTGFKAFYRGQWVPFEPPLSREDFPIPFANKAVQNAIRPLHEDQLADLLRGTSEAEILEFEIAEVLGKPRRGRGFAPGMTSAQKKAVELRAMAVSREFLEEAGWLVEDVSAKRPFDFLARKSGAEMHVEVKGTTTLGECVVLTRGEVNHHRETDTISALHLVSDITLGEAKEAPQASGGTLWTVCPWKIDLDKLNPIAYEYLLPR